MTLGQRVRARREELGLSQDDVAKKLGFKNRSSINKIESGDREPKQQTIKALADALETNVFYILGIDEETERNEKELCKLFKICHGSDTFETVQAFLSLDDNDKEAVKAMINSLLSTQKYKKAASKSA